MSIVASETVYSFSEILLKSAGPETLLWHGISSLNRTPQLRRQSILSMRVRFRAARHEKV
jgi:hypothetical protein